MYRQLTSQQRSQIFALLQRKTPRKEIALIVGCSQSTLCRELKRNSTAKGNYLWEKAQRLTLERRKRTTSNKKLDSVLVWRIKQMIIDHQWSPEQIRGVLAKEGVSRLMKAENCAVTADIPTSDDDQKANANPLKPPTYQTAQAYTTDRPRPTADALAILRWILLLMPTGTRF